MPCPTMHIDIVSRGKGQSCMATCAYNAGKKMWSQYECCWKQPHSSARRVKRIEVMLPPNAPKKYADPQTLWNAVDAAEKSSSAQTARTIIIALPKELTYEQNLDLIHDYCQKQFVDKGMCVNLFYHDEGDGNPHVHLMLTMRAMDEQGRWLPKSRNVYQLDANGERMTRANGSFIRTKVDTVDWNDRKYGEIWRHEWELAQNAALEAAGRTERVDMRSLQRQGIADQMPQMHLGPAASALERKGEVTNRGSENRNRISINKLLAYLRKTIQKLTASLEEMQKVTKAYQTVKAPEDYTLTDVVMAYGDLRKAERSLWSKGARSRGDQQDLTRLSETVIFMKENNVRTVGDIAAMLDRNRAAVKEIGSVIQEKNQQIRDINAFLNGIDAIKETKGVVDGLDRLHWKRQREAYLQDHAAEFKKYNDARWLCEKLIKKLNLTTPVTKEQQKALKATTAQLQSEIEQLRPELERSKHELDQLKGFRYIIRKVLPEALPDPEQNELANQGETIRNQYDLDRLISHVVDAVTETREGDVQSAEKEEPKRQKQGQEL